MAVTIEDMRDQLLTLDEARERLSTTEPLGQIQFVMRGSENEVPKFHLEPAWNAGIEAKAGTDVVSATVTVGGTEYQLTKDAALTATSSIGLTRQYVGRTPSTLIEPHLNYWFANKDGEAKLLVQDTTVLAITKASVSPFSNLRLVEEAITGIEAKYGAGEVLVDYKMHHDLRMTAIRLVVPDHVRAVREDDNWSAGIQIRNSLVGESPLSLEGYLFRWWCTNGAISTHARSGSWNRRTGGQGEEAYAWAQNAVDEILGGLEHEFEALEQLAESPIEDVAVALEDVFTTYKVPLEAREAIITEMVNSDDLTMYGVMQAITQAANGPDVRESVRLMLMEVGGDLPRANAERCSKCRRLQH